MRKIDVGRGTENGALKFAAVFGLSTKNHRGALAPPPIGSRAKGKPAYCKVLLFGVTEAGGRLHEPRTESQSL